MSAAPSKRARLQQYAACIMAAMLGAPPAWAHHSFAMYEPWSVTLKGTVSGFQWTNPHVVLRIFVQPEDGGAAQQWSFETNSPAVLSRAGWSRRSIKAGDRVSVTFSPLRDGSQGGGQLNSVTLLETGQKFVASRSVT
jgi:hypothetical protein